MKKWNTFTARELRPSGWMLQQLEIQAKGLSGHLDKIWKDVKDSAWIGGSAEGWERVPYWLDGFVPLAYLLEDADLIARAKKYISAIIDRQQPSGWICPCNETDAPAYDTWATQLIAKVLVVYYECSGDENIPHVVYNIMKNYHELLSSGKIKLFDWGKYRWFESFIALNFLWKRYHEDWILSLAKILKEQGTDYRAISQLWKRPLNKWTLDTHVVNLAMMLKHEAVSCELLGAPYTDEAEDLLSVLTHYNGTPVGLFTGDECLSGLSPVQGTELCAVAEQMYSYENLLTLTGESKWAERLELLAFNALPATIDDDMWAHQYVQMSNQIACERFPGKPVFRTNGAEAHLFGLEPHYGCCTANFNQAWPKLALSAFLWKDNTVYSAIPIPSTLQTESASVTLNTNYPFENKLNYVVESKKALTLQVRVPSFAKKLTVNGVPYEKSEILSFTIPEGRAQNIEITFETEPEIIDRPHGLKSVKCGSLVFALPVAYEKRMHEYERNGVERKFPYCDYEYLPKSAWNYALSSPVFRVERRGVDCIPFHSTKPPVVLHAEVKKINWGLEDGYESVCAKIPESREPISDAETLELYPYGCAKLRITELPLL